LPVTSGIMADLKGARTLAAADNAGVHTKNAINVAMEDLTEYDKKEVERELEEEMAELRRRKLACIQKTRNDVIKKADTATSSGPKVNSYLCPEYLTHMVDMSVASKYGDDLTQFIRVMAEDLRSTFDALKQDLSSSLPRQVRAMVQQISREAQGKRVEGSSMIPNPGHTANPGNSGMLINISQPDDGSSLNPQQPLY
jgi:activator of HSP90 ATPase